MKTQITQLNQDGFKKWIEGKESEVINQENILLTEEIHTHSKYINISKLVEKFQDKDSIDKVIIVRRLKERGYKDRYSLITGIKWLKVARALDKPINCIVLGARCTRPKFIELVMKGTGVKEEIKVPEGTEFLYSVGRVKIAAYLKKCCPNGAKYNKKEEYYLQNQVIDKPITVIRNGQDKNDVVVVDEYIRFLILVKHDVKNIPVKFAVNN